MTGVLDPYIEPNRYLTPEAQLPPRAKQGKGSLLWIGRECVLVLLYSIGYCHYDSVRPGPFVADNPPLDSNNSFGASVQESPHISGNGICTVRNSYLRVVRSGQLDLASVHGP